MTILILIFSALILLAGIVILVNPEMIFGLLRKNIDNIGLHILAVVVRLILGLLLIYQASAARFPLIIEIIGWISIIAAISLAVIGRRNFRRVISWALSLVTSVGRVAGLLATVFGLFLIYAFI